jgi:hypothetical protein
MNIENRFLILKVPEMALDEKNPLTDVKNRPIIFEPQGYLRSQ